MRIECKTRSGNIAKMGVTPEKFKTKEAFVENESKRLVPIYTGISKKDIEDKLAAAWDILHPKKEVKE